MRKVNASFFILLAVIMFTATSVHAQSRVAPGRQQQGTEVIDLTQPQPATAPSGSQPAAGDDEFGALEAQTSGIELRKRAAGSIFAGFGSTGLGDSTKRIRTDGYTFGAAGRFSFMYEAIDSEKLVQDCGLLGSLATTVAKDHYQESQGNDPSSLNGRFVGGGYCTFRVGKAYLGVDAQAGADIGSRSGYMGTVIAQHATLFWEPRVPRYSITLMRAAWELSVANEARVGSRDFQTFYSATELIWTPVESDRVDFGFGPKLSIQVWEEPVSVGSAQLDTSWGVNGGGVVRLLFFDRKDEHSYGLKADFTAGGQKANANVFIFYSF